MAKIIDINTVSRKALNDLLPMGAFTQIQARLAEKGHKVSYPTIRRAMDPTYPMTRKIALVIEEGIRLREEMKQRSKIHVIPEVIAELSHTGS